MTTKKTLTWMIRRQLYSQSPPDGLQERSQFFSSALRMMTILRNRPLKVVLPLFSDGYDVVCEMELRN